MCLLVANSHFIRQHYLNYEDIIPLMHLLLIEAIFIIPLCNVSEKMINVYTYTRAV